MIVRLLYGEPRSVHLLTVEVLESVVSSWKRPLVRDERNDQIPAQAIDHFLHTEAQWTALESKGVEAGAPQVTICPVTARSRHNDHVRPED